MENEHIVRTVIRTGQQPTDAQIREIEMAASRPIIPDEDAPELTLEQYAEMATLGKLYEYDRNNPDIQLTRTLYQYMINQYNAAYTAHVLGIHRTTLLYRLNKMQQISPFDLNDPQVCLQILLSFELVPELKGHPCN